MGEMTKHNYVTRYNVISAINKAVEDCKVYMGGQERSRERVTLNQRLEGRESGSTRGTRRRSVLAGGSHQYKGPETGACLGNGMNSMEAKEGLRSLPFCHRVSWSPGSKAGAQEEIRSER